MEDIILVSCACYNNEDEVVSFAKQLENQTIHNNIVFIVNINSSKNKELLSQLNNLSIKCLVYDIGSNLGYLHGCLYGIDKFSKTETYRWAIITNTDITICDDDYFEKMFSDSSVNSSDVWCVGSKIILSSTNLNQNPFSNFRPSRKKMIIRKIMYSNILFFRLYFKLASMKKKTAVSKELPSGVVYAVHGSSFAIRPELVSKLIDNRDEIFMYGEELLIAELVRENCKKVYYYSLVSLNHNENQVTKSVAWKRKQKWFFKSTKYLVDRFS